MSNSYVAVSLSGGKDSTAMKPTDEERREVAEKLRTMCMGGCRYAEQFYELLKEKVMNAWDFHEFEDVADRLADLIEPEPERTCRAEQDYEAMEDGIPDCRIWRCECGEKFPFWRGLEPNFCPNCGARVEGAER